MEAPLVERTPAQRLDAIDALARQLALELHEATEAGVSHALILPRLVLVFRETFGEMPAGFTIPGLPGVPA